MPHPAPPGRNCPPAPRRRPPRPPPSGPGRPRPASRDRRARSAAPPPQRLCTRGSSTHFPGVSPEISPETYARASRFEDAGDKCRTSPNGCLVPVPGRLIASVAVRTVDRRSVPVPTQNLADGTVVEYDAEGRLVRQELPDGTVFDRFTSDGKPTHGTLPDAGQVSISYGGDGGSTWSYADGTIVSRSADGGVVGQVTADGAVFDAFTSDGKPTHGTLPDAGQVSISYDGDGGSTWSYADGTIVSRSADGGVVGQVTADGAVFDAFTSDGKPTHGTLPGGDGAGAQQVSISYNGDGGSTWSYADGTIVSRSADGGVVGQVTSDGAVFDRFTSDGKPTHGTLPDAGQVSISYNGDGGSTWSYADGTIVSRSADGGVVGQVTADGAVFDAFTSDGKPTHGTLPGGDGAGAQQVSISYNGDGGSTWSYADGTIVSRSADGGVVGQVTADGAVFDAFTSDGKPTHGTLPGGDGAGAQQVSISYNGDGGSTWSYADGTIVSRSADGGVVGQVTSDGAVFDAFTSDGKPTHGTLPDAGQVSISYNGDGGSTWSYADGTIVSRSADGGVVGQVTADGAVFDAFTSDGKPTHGTLPGGDGAGAQQVSISYNGDGGSTWSYADGTIVSRSADGGVVGQVTSDGAVFDAFTSDGKPTHGTLPGGDGAGAQQVSISYNGDGGSTWSYADGTIVSRSADGGVVGQVTADGAVFDAFTSDGKPTHGTLPGGDGAGAQQVSISYNGDGGSTWSYADGTIVSRSADGGVVGQVTSDGAVFDAFSGDGRPTHGTVNGQQVTISYNADGTSTWTYADGTSSVQDADGDPLRQTSADGASFDAFTADGRPIHGTVGGQEVNIAYNADGTSTWSYADGTVSLQNADGDPVRQTTADGAVFDRFNDQARPTHGTVGGQSVDISYAADGASTWTYDDGSTIQRNPDGDVVRQTTADGAVFERFDADGKPIQGTVGGQAVDITYNGDGSSIYNFADGSAVERNANGDLIRQRTADGAVFDKFTSDGRPTHGTMPGAGGGTPQDVDISYNGDGSSTYRFDDGSSVDRNADGDVLRMTTPEGAVFDRFTVDGKPTHGTVGGQAVDVVYDGDGGSVWTYGDGTTVTRNADGDVVRQVTADGAVFDRFTVDGKPTHGTVGGQAVDVVYDGDGGSVWTYGDGTTVTRNADGDVVRQVTADGAVFDRFTADGKPTHGTVDGQAVDIAYDGDGGSVWTYGDGTTVSRNADGDVVRQVTADGAVFDRFTADGKPTHGTVDGQAVDIAYNGDGSSIWTYAGDGAKVFRSPDGTVVRQELADGSVYDQFNSGGKPTHGTVGGQAVSISYANDGTSIWTYEGDGTRVHRDPDGNVTKQILADGTTYDSFDADGRPVHGTVPARDGQPAQEVSVIYAPDGSSTWKYGDGTILKRNGAGDVTLMQSGGWTFAAFDSQGRPTAGKEDDSGNTVKIVYAQDGTGVWTYSDGTIVTRDANGDVKTMQSNGWTYDEFDAGGRPTHGYDGKGNTVDITYKADGIIESKFGDGTVVGTDKDGKPIYQIVNGERADYAIEIPKLGAAIKTIAGERDLIESNLKTLKSFFEDMIGTVWVSPSGAKYQELVKDMGKLTTDTKGLLDDAILAMQKSYDNYVGAEGTNTQNMTNTKS
ncbi:beta strand repeat-containing protein [Micromonospora sp. LH3U1]|uniref:beta strand repeat-containing protein n=1 Tax=Micromonospora sp. LH3U1 TaxID=3018339 RepID=UPI00234B7DC3|nr:hypothetical protein [Micromonospora sp. LH3U1]WCN83231.1 hypothetical protein PCA76_09355 [Micromonospora sp. LH3U1]